MILYVKRLQVGGTLSFNILPISHLVGKTQEDVKQDLERIRKVNKNNNTPGTRPTLKNKPEPTSQDNTRVVNPKIQSLLIEDQKKAEEQTPFYNVLQRQELESYNRKLPPEVKTMNDSFEYLRSYYKSPKFKERHLTALKETWGNDLYSIDPQNYRENFLKKDNEKITNIFKRDSASIQQRLRDSEYFLLQGSTEQPWYDELIRDWRGRPNPEPDAKGEGSYTDKELNRTFVFNNQTDELGNYVPVKMTAPHEFSHLTQYWSKIPFKQMERVKSMQRYPDSYLSDLNETKADLDALRYLLYDSKIYDARYEDFTKDHLNKYIEKTKGDKFKPYKRLLELYGEKKLIQLMNELANAPHKKGFERGSV